MAVYRSSVVSTAGRRSSIIAHRLYCLSTIPSDGRFIVYRLSIVSTSDCRSSSIDKSMTSSGGRSSFLVLLVLSTTIDRCVSFIEYRKSIIPSDRSSSTTVYRFYRLPIVVYGSSAVSTTVPMVVNPFVPGMDYRNSIQMVVYRMTR